MAKPILLSIDLDFFSYEDPMWDWQHGEALWPDLLWAARFVAAASMGIDLTYETRLELADFHPLKVFEVLKGYGWQVSKHCELTVSDSHVFALPAWRSVPEARIVNLDAHHDLGYGNQATMQQRWEAQQVQCEDWLWFLLRKNVHVDAVSVFPTWKNQGTWSNEPHWDGTELGRRVRLTSYSPEVMRSLAGEVVGIHIARSGAWLPPWHDSLMPALALRAVRSTPIRGSGVYILGDPNPMERRDFDIEAYRAQVRPHVPILSL